MSDREPRRAMPWRQVALGVVVGTALLWLSLYVSAHQLPLPERLAIEDSVVVTYRDGVPGHVFLSQDEKWRISRPVDAIEPLYVEALITLEDRRFEDHAGVDLLAVGRAAVSNFRARRRVSGASTITMQLARLLEPRQRTYGAKILEAWRAYQLEQRLSKEEILEAYLRFLPFGRNVEGIEAAAWTYFGHGADALSPDEIALLLAVPQAPAARYPSEANAASLTAARDRILARLIEADVFDASQAGVAPPVPQSLRPLPREIPHVARDLRQRRRATEPLQIATHLDRAVQTRAEAAIRQREGQTRAVGIANVAVVVVEHETAEVRAMIGNHGLTDGPSSYLSSYDAPRSPGSLLKPFIYAASLDAGLAMAEHLVLDVPFSRGDYVAENYSGTFSGLVSLEDALGQSLNIPFIRLLEELGVEAHLDALRRMGAGHLRDEPGRYGLSVAVGALEITAKEAAGFYATLARGGVYRPLQLIVEAEVRAAVGPDTPVFTVGASWLTRRGLGRLDRPDFPARRQAGLLGRSIAWKTGTSTGNRDAWAAGFGERFTVVVWLGNLDQRPHPGLIGSEAAAPILFDILESLEAGLAPSAPRSRPEDLTEVTLCAHSGHLPTEACPTTKQALAPLASVAAAPCPFHVRYDVDIATGELLTPECRAGLAYTSRAFLIWPPEALRWLTEQQRRAAHLPPYGAHCVPLPSPHRPRIAAPAPGQTLALRQGLPARHQQVALRADAHLVDYPLSWFVNGELVARATTPRPVFWEPREGEHRVTVVDRTGRADHRSLRVILR